ncbi:hypothetical protein [Stutzerimonas nitrititolerans]|uniref:hypothetical protein n=1 Tax=Stutzerimonas nitrititolerans TaxID=2482751 RepID=UPI00289655D0|nr:hypothetical protein [Stutzerimonas nitrititolerans]
MAAFNVSTLSHSMVGAQAGISTKLNTSALFRLPLLPFAILIEIFLLTIAWLIAVARPAFAVRLVSWAENNLPSLSWYWGGKRG